MYLLSPIYKWEVDWLHWLQNLPVFDGNWEVFWLAVTKLGDPGWAFFVYFPILLPFLGPSIFKLLLAACVSEYTNGVLKWIMHGERPYWYVKEHLGLASLKQFKWTCETGPGSPSGHVMCTATVFWVLVSILRKGQSRRNSLMLQLTFGVFITLVGISRLYIAAHFPHQILFGIITGMCLGEYISRMCPEDWTVPKWFWLSAGMSLVCKFVHDGLLAVGLDPGWSIAKALKYCDKSEWIHLSTTPIASFFRDLSTIFSMGLALQISPIFSTQYSSHTLHVKLVYSFISLLVSQLLCKLPHSEYGQAEFYAMTSISNVLNVFLITVAIPYCSMRKFKPRKE